MKIITGVLIVAGLAVGTARPVRAQCNTYCAVLSSPLGTTFTCYYAPDSNANCTSLSRGCRIQMCETALLTNPVGQTTGLASLCGGNVTMRPLAHTSKPRSAAKLRAQRGTATLAVARKARAPSAG